MNPVLSGKHTKPQNLNQLPPTLIMKAKHIKDHVSTYGKDLKRATNKKFDINPSLIIRAVNGDEKALTEIGDKGKLGERLQMAMPLIRENLKAYIEGTKEYNIALADIYKTGGKASLAIDKAGSEVGLANTQYLNTVDEYTAKMLADAKKQGQRHHDALDVIELTAWIDAQTATVNNQAQMEGISNRPMLAQMQADKDYENAKINHLLEHGSDGDLSLIPKKHFTNNPVVKVWESIRNIFS
jgi:hypothetical protein